MPLSCSPAIVQDIRSLHPWWSLSHVENLQSYLQAYKPTSITMTGYTKDRDVDEIQQGTTLGHLRLRHVETNEIILIPTPSNDPNDPLNW